MPVPSEPKTVTINMSWTGAMRILLAALANGTAVGRRMAEEELMSLAESIDSLNAGKSMTADSVRIAELACGIGMRVDAKMAALIRDDVAEQTVTYQAMIDRYEGEIGMVRRAVELAREFASRMPDAFSYDFYDACDRIGEAMIDTPDTSDAEIVATAVQMVTTTEVDTKPKVLTHCGQVTVKDASGAEVEMSIFTDPTSNGTFAVDSSFIEQIESRTVPNVFNPHGPPLQLPEL